MLTNLTAKKNSKPWYVVCQISYQAIKAMDINEQYVSYSSVTSETENDDFELNDCIPFDQDEVA